MKIVEVNDVENNVNFVNLVANLICMTQSIIDTFALDESKRKIVEYYRLYARSLDIGKENDVYPLELAMITGRVTELFYENFQNLNMIVTKGEKDEM